METCVLFQDLRETIDKQSEQIRKLKKMLKIYAKKLKDGEGEQNDAFSFFFFLFSSGQIGMVPFLCHSCFCYIFKFCQDKRLLCSRYIYIKNKECEEKKLL